MKYLEFQPSESLKRFIKCYWILEDDAAATAVQTIVPDGRAELIINLASPFEHQKDQGWQRQPSCFVVGQITGPLMVRPNGPAKILGVRFRPEGARHLLGIPMNELTNSVVAVAEISPRLQRRLERLGELRSLTAQVAELDRIMSGCAADAEEDARMGFAVREFERAGGLIGIERLADRIGLSSRQFERRFRNAVGISPKLFSRMQRFQLIFQVMDQPQANWIDTAIQCGYYDQAHLIRDFREFSGKTPTALLAQEFDLARYFLQPRAMSHLSKTTSLTSR